ncbi:fusaric acid resistance protein [Burkholderia sp. Leaf177]|uniref:FUSC family protein n=1 Tax=Burkholderia sp. Leaf177 TaxID=1736287 RepID=UPI0006FF80A2|nr:FUSC family protein [Burkholderia sp. Leaf177]KQR89942.1 fusaric acid resistance protein [Burkholderia sp. Leaf177]
MALPAADRVRPGAADILKLLAPFPGRAAMACRIALICALTAYVTSAYGTMEAAISAYVVFFLNQPDRVMSIVQGVAMLVLVTVFIGIVLVVAMFALDNPLWRVACIAGLSFGLLFVTSASKLRPVGAILAMIIGFLLDELGSVPFGEVATRALLYAWLMTAIPFAVSVCVNLLLAPSPRRLVGRALGRRLRIAARALLKAEETRDALKACLREGDASIRTWLKLSAVDGSSARADIPALGEATSSTLAILVAVDLAAREPSGRLPASFAAPIAEALENMARMLEAGGYPVDIELDLPDIKELPTLARIAVEDLQRAVTRFAVIETDANTESPRPAAKSGGFFLPDAFTNPEHVRYALKTTAAAMFCYLLYTQINWPGIHTCFITVYMVSLGTTAETVEKMTLRIGGCFIGAILGTAAIVFMMPVTTSALGLMAIVFIGSWFAAWIAFGSPRIAYAGFQIALVFFMCVIQGPAPAFDLTIARDRTIGILIGNVVVYLIFTRVWPVSVAGRVDAGLIALKQQWKKIATLADSRARRMQAASAMARLGALEQDLAMMHYEPSWVRPDAQWIAERRNALAKLGVLETPIFLLAERNSGDTAIDAWMDRLSSENGSSGAAAMPPAETETDTFAALQNLGNSRLSQLEHAAPTNAAKGFTTHAAA